MIFMKSKYKIVVVGDHRKKGWKWIFIFHQTKIKPNKIHQLKITKATFLQNKKKFQVDQIIQEVPLFVNELTKRTRKPWNSITINKEKSLSVTTLAISVKVTLVSWTRQLHQIMEMIWTKAQGASELLAEIDLELVLGNLKLLVKSSALPKQLKKWIKIKTRIKCHNHQISILLIRTRCQTKLEVQDPQFRSNLRKKWPVLLTNKTNLWTIEWKIHLINEVINDKIGSMGFIENRKDGII